MIRFFRKGDVVICIDSSRMAEGCRLQEGKKFIVSSPDFVIETGFPPLKGNVLIHLERTHAVYSQFSFMTIQEDRHMDREIREALIHHLKQK
jgi:hypothetical protein